MAVRATKARRRLFSAFASFLQIVLLLLYDIDRPYLFSMSGKDVSNHAIALV